jgi:uncharacterized membrane protein
MRGSGTVALLIAIVVAMGPLPAAELSDGDALAVVQKHCGPCHARNPTHPAFDKTPKGIALETLADLKRYAERALEQVEDRTMPLGNETGMTDDEREAFGRWVKALK